ncbi:MAG TPA: hypothetical protein VM925_14410 [Labilithrix sp.]|nr:hypothetical protein [Labilithrix sp.]
MRATRLVSGLVLVVLVGCTADAPKKRASPGDRDAASDVPTGASVFLKARMHGERAVVDVTARGVGEIHGLAFRLHWAPEKVAFVEARASDAWSKEAVLLAKEGIPGELVVVWAEKGSARAKTTDETVLGSLDFAPRTTEAIPLLFRQDRSTVRDAKGAPIPVVWRGTQISAP